MTRQEADKRERQHRKEETRARAQIREHQQLLKDPKRLSTHRLVVYVVHYLHILGSRTSRENLAVYMELAVRTVLLALHRSSKSLDEEVARERLEELLNLLDRSTVVVKCPCVGCASRLRLVSDFSREATRTLSLSRLLHESLASMVRVVSDAGIPSPGISEFITLAGELQERFALLAIDDLRGRKDWAHERRALASIVAPWGLASEEGRVQAFLATNPEPSEMLGDFAEAT